MNRISLQNLGLLACAIISLAGCQYNNKANDSASFAAGPRASTSGVAGVNAANLPGKIYFTDVSQQAGFQQAAAGFLSTDVPPEYIGQVNPNGTGIRFGGRVSLTTGSLRSLNGGSATISANSTFVIQVIDQAAQTGRVAALPAMQFKKAQGEIMGNQAQITFGDAFGSITLQGVLSQTSFDGYASYDNNVRWDGSTPGAGGNLGNFSVPLCSFFVCN